MNNWVQSGSTEITDHGIKKFFKKYEPTDALYELVWNGIDAGASQINVSIQETECGGVVSASVCDNGNGIDFANLDSNFGKFNDSAKKEDPSLHGSHGRGRLAFHVMCDMATWHTKTEYGEAKIHVHANNLKDWKAEGTTANQHSLLAKKKTGTCVELGHFHENLPENSNLLSLFSEQFGWKLALDTHKSISINGLKVPIPAHERFEISITVDSITFSAIAIRWKKRPTSEKSFIYLLNSEGHVVHNQHSKFNHKSDFFISVYVQSQWADNFVRGHGNLFDGSKSTEHSAVWRGVLLELNEFIGDIYKNFLRQHAEEKIAEFEKQNVFPIYKNLNHEDASWRLENTKNIVKSVYIADPKLFGSLSIKQCKLIVRILDRISVSNENENLYDVLSGVLDLDQDSIDMLSKQLRRSSLENIIRTIEVLQRRQEVIDKMKFIMEERYHELNETPDLQGIIEANTWLFGDQFETIGAEEDSFKKIAEEIRNKVRSINDIDQSDCEGVDDITGVLRQPDLFMIRKRFSLDEIGQKIIKFTLIEIKRPGISLNLKHLGQLDQYADIINSIQEFSSNQYRFDLILVGRKIAERDFQIKSRRETARGKGTFGLVSDTARIRSYVLDWATLLTNFEIANNYLLDNLKMKRDSYSDEDTSELVIDLQAESA